MSVDAGGAKARSPRCARAASGCWRGPKHKHRRARLQLPIEVYRRCKWCCRQPSPTQPKLQKNKGEVTDELLRPSASPIPRKGIVVETFPYYLRNCSVTSPLVGSPVSTPRLTTHCLRVVGWFVACGSWFVVHAAGSPSSGCPLRPDRLGRLLHPPPTTTTRHTMSFLFGRNRARPSTVDLPKQARDSVTKLEKLDGPSGQAKVKCAGRHGPRCTAAAQLTPRLT